MRSLRLGLFLAIRQILRGSPWTTLLIIFVMSLTFLNLVVVSGVLVGLTAGASLAFRTQYTGDVILQTFPTKSYIERSVEIIDTMRTIPGILSVSPRYLAGGMAESNYRTAVGSKDDPDSASAELAGIDPLRENDVTNLSMRLLEGEYLDPDEEGYVLVGKNLLSQYTVGGILSDTLKDVEVGTRIRVMVGNERKEVIVKGIVGSKVGEVSRRIFFVDRELRSLIGRTDYNVDEIAIRIAPSVSAESVRDALKQSGFEPYAKIQTSAEAQGTFLDQISTTFSILGSVIGGIALVVASITIFIVIFINAVTRRKYIGILKGIGISPLSIECSYVIQSVVYALGGSAVGLTLLYGVIKPYFDANPIDFPFSDGLLVAPLDGSLEKIGILVIATIIAGYIPARLIIKKNTLDAILGR